MAKNKEYKVGFVFGARKDSSFGGVIGTITGGLKDIIKTAGGLAAAKFSIDGIKDAVNTFSEFQQSMANTAAVSGATGDEFKALEEAAMEMGRKTSKTAAEAADALGYMALAGWNTQDMIGGLEPILRLSEAGNIDLATASDLVTDSMSNMGIAVDDLGGFLDVVAKGQASSNTNAQQMMEAYLKIGGTLKEFNTDLDESAVFLGVLANRGKKGAEAGTAFNSILRNMQKDTGAAGKAMAELGLDLYDSQGEFRGLTTVFEELNAKTQDMTQEQRNYYMNAIGGQYADDLRKIMSGLNDVNEEGQIEFYALREALQDCDGALLETADIMNDTVQGAFARLSSATDDLKIQLVKQFEGNIQGAIDGLAEFIPKVTEKLVGGLQTVKSVVGPILTQIGTSIQNSKIFALGENIKHMLSEKSLSGVGMESFLSGIGLDEHTVAFALVFIRKIESAVRKLFSGDFQGANIKLLEALGFSPEAIGTLTGIAEKVSGFGNAIKETFHSLAGGIMGQVPKVLSLLQDVGNFFVTRLGPPINSVLGYLTETALPKFTGFFEKNFPKIISIVQGLWQGIKSAIDHTMDILGVFWDFAGPLISSAVTFISEQISAVVDFLDGLISFFVNIFQGNWEGAWEGIKNIVRSVGDSLVSLIKLPINFIIDIINGFIKGLKKIQIPDWVPGVGGKGMNISEIPKLESGGVVTAPTLAMVGEGKEDEAVLPLSKLAGLLQSSASSVLSAFLNQPQPAGAYGETPLVINVNVEGDGDEAAIYQAAEKAFQQFKQFYDRMKRDKNRVTLGKKS